MSEFSARRACFAPVFALNHVCKKALYRHIRLYRLPGYLLLILFSPLQRLYIRWLKPLYSLVQGQASGGMWPLSADVQIFPSPGSCICNHSATLRPAALTEGVLAETAIY